MDFIDENETLMPADDSNFTNKHNLQCPFICGCRDLGEALHRIAEGAVMVRTAGNLFDNVAEAIGNLHSVLGQVSRLQLIDEDELYSFAKGINAPFKLVKLTKQSGRLPVILFGFGGTETPADAAMLMQIGWDGVFVDSFVFDCEDPASRVQGFIQAVAHHNDSHILAKVSSSMADLDINYKDLVQTQQTRSSD